MANSYKDPYWSNLSANTEKLLKLPTGLLQNIVLHGEKSNADQVSSAGAKTVFQIIPSTRNQVLKKYGVDAYLNDKNAAMAAGLLLKESLTRNNGNIEAAIGEYHGGTDRSNWGPVNKAYRKRVVGAMDNPARDEYKANSDKLLAEFDRRKAELSKTKLENSNESKKKMLLARFDELYPQRKTQPQGLPDFDENGVIREDQPQQPKPQQAPLSTMDKIIGGLETGATLATGAVGGAIGQAAGGLHGIAESVVDGTFGTQQGAQNAVNRATQLSNTLTYEPKTAGGQRAVGAVGEFIEDTGLDTLPPVLGGGVGTSAATLGRASVPVATTAAREVAQAAKPVVAQAVEQAKRPVAAVTEVAKNTFNRNVDADAGGSMGAAAVPAAEVRQSLFDEFDIPATTAQVSRDQTELADMYNLARKGGEAGKVIQDTLDQQQARLASAIDDMIEAKGARTVNSEEVGASIKEVLNTQYKVEHAAQNRAYETVRNSEGAQTRVDIDNLPKWSKEYLKQEAEAGRTPDSNRSILDVINEESYLKTSKVYTDAKDLAVKLNIAQLDGDGNLAPMPKEKRPNIIQVEQFRQRIGEMGESTRKADGPAVQKLKALIDNALDNSGSNAFKQARKNYAEFKQSWSNKAILKDLIDRKSKASPGDQKVINEKIIDRIVGGSTSQKDLEFVQNVVNKSEGGKDAWTDMQASILDRIRNEAFSGAADSSGNGTLVFNKMDKIIRKLDGATGRLDTLLGREQAQKVRDANELARIIRTVPPNTGVNWSNTMTALAAAVDGIIFGISGMPATFATALRFALKYIHEKKDVAKAHSIIRRAEKPKGGSGKF